MKTKSLRSLLSLWAALLLSSALFLLPASAEGETITFSLRIEGITANVFYKTVTVPSDGTPTLQEALLEVEKAEEGLRRIEAKLSNENFVSKAPANVVEGQRQQAEKYRALIAKLEESAAQMRS